MKALLIIDMQRGSFKSTKRFHSKKVIKNINKLSITFRKTNDKVVFVQHDGSKENNFIPGTEDWGILPQLIQDKADKYISKIANDSFYNSELDDYLKKQKITEIYITGCATDYCVNATVHSALVKDYNIIIVSDGHTTANRQMIKAKKLIKFHNWLWQNLTTTGGRISLKNTKEILELN